MMIVGRNSSIDDLMVAAADCSITEPLQSIALSLLAMNKLMQTDADLKLRSLK